MDIFKRRQSLWSADRKGENGFRIEIQAVYLEGNITI